MPADDYKLLDLRGEWMILYGNWPIGRFKHKNVAEQFRELVLTAQTQCMEWDDLGFACPECGVWAEPRGTTSTAVAWGCHRDDEGRVHHHDPNRYTTGYTCPNGHEFARHYYQPCPRCGKMAGEATFVERDEQETP